MTVPVPAAVGGHSPPPSQVERRPPPPRPPTDVSCGRSWGRRRIKKNNKEIPLNKIISPEIPGPGYAVFQQGKHVVHRATGLTSPVCWNTLKYLLILIYPKFQKLADLNFSFVFHLDIFHDILWLWHFHILLILFLVNLIFNYYFSCTIINH